MMNPLSLCTFICTITTHTQEVSLVLASILESIIIIILTRSSILEFYSSSWEGKCLLQFCAEECEIPMQIIHIPDRRVYNYHVIHSFRLFNPVSGFNDDHQQHDYVISFTFRVDALSFTLFWNLKLEKTPHAPVSCLFRNRFFSYRNSFSFWAKQRASCVFFFSLINVLCQRMIGWLSWLPTLYRNIIYKIPLLLFSITTDSCLLYTWIFFILILWIVLYAVCTLYRPADNQWDDDYMIAMPHCIVNLS